MQKIKIKDSTRKSGSKTVISAFGKEDYQTLRKFALKVLPLLQKEIRYTNEHIKQFENYALNIWQEDVQRYLNEVEAWQLLPERLKVDLYELVKPAPKQQVDLTNLNRLIMLEASLQQLLKTIGWFSDFPEMFICDIESNTYIRLVKYAAHAVRFQDQE